MKHQPPLWILPKPSNSFRRPRLPSMRLALSSFFEQSWDPKMVGPSAVATPAGQGLPRLRGLWAVWKYRGHLTSEATCRSLSQVVGRGGVPQVDWVGFEARFL